MSVDKRRNETPETHIDRAIDHLTRENYASLGVELQRAKRKLSADS